MMLALRASRSLRAAPLVAARHLRTSVPALGMVPANVSSAGALPPVDPTKYFDGESLAEHQARTRVDSPSGRTFNYAVIGGARFIGASAARTLVVGFLASMNPAADVLALASIEVDISNLAPGNCMTVKWRGKPVFIRARTDDEIEAARNVSMGELRDPASDEDRVQKPETLVVLGVCTHLGCVPINGAGDFGGWFCPCHGSHYDTSGRIRKGPAPLNLEVPMHEFVDDTKLKIG